MSTATPTIDSFPTVSFVAFCRVYHTVEISAADYVALWSETGDAGYLRIALVIAEFEAEARVAVAAALAVKVAA